MEIGDTFIFGKNFFFINDKNYTCGDYENLFHDCVSINFEKRKYIDIKRFFKSEIKKHAIHSRILLLETTPPKFYLR